MNEEMNQYPYDEGGNGNSGAVKGYRIIIIVLAAIIAVLAFQYYRSVQSLKANYDVVIEDKDSVEKELKEMTATYETLKSTNDTINANLTRDKLRADSLLEVMTKNRNWNAAELRKYKREVGTLRTLMKRYITQIDSLNRLNMVLTDENRALNRSLDSERGRADRYEEKTQELTNLVKKGSVIRARDISLLALSSKDKKVDKAKRATRLRVDFVLNANEMAVVGERKLFVRIFDPKDVILTSSPNNLFQFNGQAVLYTAARDGVDYQREDLPVSITYSGGGFTAGKYIVEIYMDGYKIGENEIVLR